MRFNKSSQARLFRETKNSPGGLGVLLLFYPPFLHPRKYSVNTSDAPGGEEQDLEKEEA